MIGRKGRAGTYAERRYREGLRSWRRENRRVFAACAAPLFVVGVVGGVLAGDIVAWLAGLFAGGAVTLWVSFRDTPPRYVETWREGAEGERRTEKALRPLERAGWRVAHDIQARFGNYDHIAVGPTGVYLLESKTAGRSQRPAGRGAPG